MESIEDMISSKEICMKMHNTSIERSKISERMIYLMRAYQKGEISWEDTYCIIRDDLEMYRKIVDEYSRLYDWIGMLKASEIYEDNKPCQHTDAFNYDEIGGF